MATFNTVTSNAKVSGTELVTLYTCPSDKSHAVVDINFFRPIGNENLAAFMIAVTSNAFASAVEGDYLFSKTMVLATEGENFFANKIIVGKNQSIYVKGISGSCNIRLEGIEENNSLILEAGKLAGKVLSTAGFTNMFKTSFSSTASVTMVSTSVRNAGASPAIVSAYITSAVSPGLNDHTADVVIEPGQYALFANNILKPNETLFLKTTFETVYAHVNGMTQS